VLTSPPYNIGSKQAKKIGGRRQGGYDAKSWGAIEGYSDSLPEEKYQRWQKEFLLRCLDVLAPRGIIAYNHKDRHVRGKLICPESWFPKGLDLFDKIIWNRGSTHNHCQCYAYQQHEYFFLLKRSGDKHYYNRGRLDSVVNLPPAIGIGHNAPMPVALAMEVIQKFSPCEGLVCDPFFGSGTTAIASMLVGRRFVGSEKLKKYWLTANARLKKEVQK
jgi:DNA modification methylase